MSNGSSSHPWADLPAQLESAIHKASQDASNDGQLQAFIHSNAITSPMTFGIKASGNDNSILVTVGNGKLEMHTGTAENTRFVLSALPEQWQEFFKQTPVAPYQSYWGMFGMNIRQEGIKIQGDQTAFANWTQVWRRVLELLHDALTGPSPADEEPELDQDQIIGRYMYIKSPVWGRCKVFYEQSGEGDQEILFLHTAGSDSRQYHGVSIRASWSAKSSF